MNQKNADTADNSLTLLSKKIEEKLGWGTIDDWTERNFQALGDQLERTTGERMSITTLKRAMGRISRKSLPHPRTLDSMAKFAGYQDWTDYQMVVQEETAQDVSETDTESKKATSESILQEEETASPLTPSEKASYSKWLITALLVALVISCLYIFSLSHTVSKLQILTIKEGIEEIDTLQNTSTGTGEIKVSYTDYDYEKGQFIINIAYYVPNINLSNVNLIKFDNKLEYLSVSENKKQGVATHTYTEPGIYAVKIFSNKQTVAQKTIVIPTKDWTGYLILDKKDNDKKYIFDTRKSNRSDLKAMLADRHDRFWTSYRNFKDFATEHDKFVLQTRFRNIALNNETRDGNSYLEILGDQNKIRIQMANRHSNGGFYQIFSEQKHEVKGDSPLAFKSDLSNWQELIIENNDKHITVKLGDQMLYETTYKQSIGIIKGFNFTFAGLGEIDYLKIYDLNSKLVYAEEF